MEYVPKHTTENHFFNGFNGQKCMVCNVCIGICDSFVMVLEFSVMVL